MLRAKRLPTFLAIAAPQGLDPNLFTSRAMQWSETIWLLDLGPCRPYWQAQAAWRGVSPQDLLHALLQKLGSEYSAVLAEDPWKAVLLLEYLRERALTGLINQAELFGRKLYQQLSWSSWLAAARRYGDHCREQKVAHFSDVPFRQQLTRFMAAKQRLGQRQPSELMGASVPSMRRRFGTHVSLLWEWTFAPEQTPEPAAVTLFPDEDAFVSGFPWLSWQPLFKPTVTRHLEFPVWQWDQIEALLIEDLDRLCCAEGWVEGESVVHLLWSLVLDDTSVMPIDVRFRHPHRLHSEVGSHKTAVLQASYAFGGTFRPGPDDLCPPKPIVGWSFRVEARLSMASKLHDLFGTPAEDPTAARQRGIENQLSIPIHRFSLAGDWLPEESFQAADTADKADNGDKTNKTNKASDQAAIWGPWLAVARRRPLYIYKLPLPLDDHVHRLAFLERTATPWSTGTALHERDYFILEDYRGKWRWGYKDAEGKWCIHGVFG